MAETYAVDANGQKTHVLVDNQWIALGAEGPKITEAIKQEQALRAKQAAVIEQQNKARAQVAEVGRQPEVKEEFQAQGEEARRGLAKTVVGMAPAAAASFVPGGVVVRAGAQGVAELGRQWMQGEDFNLGGAASAAGLSGAFDVGGKVIGGITRALGSKSPGVMAKISEAELAKTKTMMQSQGLVADKALVRQAYKNFDDVLNQQGAAPVNLTNTRTALSETIAELERAPDLVKATAILNDFKKLQKGESLRSGGGTAGFDDVALLDKAINSLLGRGTTSSNERRLLMDAKHALYKDIDASNVPPAQRAALTEAKRTAQEAFARNDLNDALEAGIRRSRVSGQQIINPAQILDKMDILKKDKLFLDSFKPGEINKIEKFFVQMTQKLRASSAEGTAIILGGMGGAAGALTGAAAGSTGPTMGLMASLGAAGGVSLPSLFTKIALNDKLAPVVLRMMEKQPLSGTPVISFPIIRALANVSAAGLRGE